MSQSESKYGILSAKNSTRYSTSAVPMMNELLNAWNCGGRSTHPYRAASPRMATVAYRFTPAANENPNVRPSVTRSMAVPLCRSRYSKSCAPLLDQRLESAVDHPLRVERHVLRRSAHVVHLPHHSLVDLIAVGA